MTIQSRLSPKLHPHYGPQQQFIDTSAQIAIYGGQAGGGKTWALLAEASRHIHVPGYGAVIFRRTSPQITNEGGLWDESMAIYPQLGGVPVHTLDWVFSRNSSRGIANIGFRHLQHETDKLAWQGTQIAMLGFDELTHFTESQFFYLWSRNRTTCGITPYVRATTNPISADDPIGGWVNRLIAWWIDRETGLAIPDRSGIVRYFIRRQGEFIWGDTADELITRYGQAGVGNYHENQTVHPKSLTFIPASLSDNPTLTEKDPTYRANLLALPEVDRQRLAEGNWNAKVQAGLFFKVANLKIVNALPVKLRCCRAWDLAATDGAGDWTVGVKLCVDIDGVYYIADIRRGQWECSYRDQVIRQTADLDGSCKIRIPQDPGAAGKSEVQRLTRMLAGHVVKSLSISHGKETRARGFAAQLNSGNVKMLAADWNSGLIQRLDAFPTKGIPDDEIDAIADAFQELADTKEMMIGVGVDPEKSRSRASAMT
ncbi:MAG: phage terminase large subunit [Schlesneria sp.]